MLLGNVGAVFLFEWKTSLTAPRMAWWAVLALFPVFIVTLIRIGPELDASADQWAVILFVLIPMLINMLGTFLCTTSVVSSELEKKSWVYLAVRPNGSTAVLLGKYLAAVTWVISAALLGLTVSVLITQVDDMWRIWSILARLICLSCPAYAAVFLILGTLFPKRSMVIAVAYALIFELVISFVPAMINNLTVQYRLRALFLDWADISIDNAELDFLSLVSSASAAFHVAMLVAYTLVLLIVAVVVIRWCEFKVGEESDV
jgi:ABC-type transport system involved in multi-copper enzyme maturation permease subunit